jgi:translation initiation factor IF-1
MPREDLVELEGTVDRALGGGQYRILTDEGQEVRAKLGGRMRKFHIRVMPGDRVKVSVSPYDLTHGLVTYRTKK